MSDLILKWFFMMLAYSSPFIYVALFSRYWRKAAANSPMRICVKLVYWPVMWIIGLVCLQLSLSYHQGQWITDHGGLPLTEDDMMVFGDGPNVTASWFLTGPIALVVAYIVVSYWAGRKNEAEQVAASDR